MDQSLTNMLLWFVVFFAIIYFIIIRPNSKQQKARRAMLDSVRVREKVITIGGIHGTVTRIDEDTVTIKVADNVEIEFLRTAIQSIIDREDKEEKNSKSVKGRKFFRSRKDKDAEAGDNAPSEN